MMIRPYRSEDKEHLRDICRKTAHSSYRKNSAALAAVTLLYNDYYTENEPENIFVATDERDVPVGYVLCSVDERKFRKEMRTTYKIRLQAVCPNKKTEALAARALVAVLPVKFRAHLHIDILPEYQRMGLGSLLMDTEREHLRQLGIPYLTVLSVSTHSDGYRFYKKYGFSVLRRFFPTVVAMTITNRINV